MKTSNFITFLAGAALGAAVAVLFAPDKGTSTREKIRSKMKKHGIDLSKDELTDLLNRIRGKKTANTIESASQ